MAERTIIKRSIADCFEKFMKQGRVLFFSAPCGFGKTCVADALTEGKSVLRLSAADPDFAVPSKAGSWRILLIDDLQNLQEDEEWLPLRDLIRDCPERRFLLLSRGAPNGTLMAFQYSGLMTVLESKAFLFEREDVRRLLESWEISASDADISGIYKESIGHPLGVVVTAQRMAQGAPFSLELVAGQTKNVFLTLAPMDSYCKACSRHLDKISTDLLRAMALYREQDERWHEYLKTALTEAENYRFVRPASVFGGAILPLLEQTKWTGDAKWFKAVLTDTRVQASFYPDYLRPRMSPAENLTATEMRVLHLICADKSNAEIGEIMDIKLPTVKTHVSRVLEKLGVSRRSEAKTAAKKLWLIPEEL